MSREGEPQICLLYTECMAFQPIYFATFTSETACSDLSRLMLQTDIAWVKFRERGCGCLLTLKVGFSRILLSTFRNNFTITLSENVLVSQQWICATQP